MQRYLFLFLALGALVIGAVVVGNRPGGHGVLAFGASEDPVSHNIVVQDFASHLNFCRQIWSRTDLRPYTPEGHCAIADAWVHRPMNGALAFGYSPACVIVALPFLGLPPAWVYVLFAGGGLVACLWILSRFSIEKEKSSQAFLRLLVVALFSVPWLVTLGAGQTSLWTTAILGFFYLRLVRQETWVRLGGGELLLWGIILFVVLSKPNLGVLLAMMLLAAGAWQSVVIGGVGFVIACIILTPHLGGWPQWLYDYVGLLRHFNGEEIGSALRASVDPRISTNLTGALLRLGWVSGKMASTLGQVLWLGGMTILLVQAWRGMKPSVYLQRHWALFLLVCPNLNATEDVLLTLLLVMNPSFWERRATWNALLLLVALDVNPMVGFGRGPTFDLIPFGFLAKALLLEPLFWSTDSHRFR